MTAVFGITAASLAALALAFIAARRIPGWQGPGHHTPAAVERDRDGAWVNELNGMSGRTRRLAVPTGIIEFDGKISAEQVEAFRQAFTETLSEPTGWVMPGRRGGLPHADADWDLAPWDDAARPVTPEPDLPPLPGRYLPAPSLPHAAPDVRGRVHEGCEISDTGQQAALTALSTTCELPPAGMASSETLGSRPGEDGSGYHPPGSCDACTEPPDFSLFRKPAPGPDDTAVDMRPVPAPVAARENAAARWHLRAHVSHVIAWKPPLREYVEDVIGTSPAEDWERLLEQARGGGRDG